MSFTTRSIQSALARVRDPNLEEAPAVTAFLEAVLREIWLKIETCPTYVLTDNEFAVFNHFRNGFDDSVTVPIILRYWNSKAGHDCDSGYTTTSLGKRIHGNAVALPDVGQKNKTELSLVEGQTIGDDTYPNITHASSPNYVRDFFSNHLNKNPSKSAKIAVTTCWELPVVLKKRFPFGQRLGSIVTITGSAEDAQAATYAEYMSWRWPTYGMTLLLAVEDALLSGSDVSRNVNDSTDITVRLTDSSITLHGDGDVGTLVNISEGFAWITVAKRMTPFNSLALSEADVSYCGNREQVEHFHITLNELRPIEESDQGQCWHRLFRGGVIAKGFPTREKPVGGRGLEIPFQLMTFLAAVEFPICQDGGIILMGFSTLLIPVSRLGRDAIQWHMVVSKDEDMQILPYSIDEVPTYAPVGSVEDLKTARAILGWCGVAKVMLGTEYLRERPSRTCAAKEVTQWRGLTSLNGSFGTPGLSMLGVSIGGTMVIERAAVAMDRSTQPGKILLQARRELLLLYDTVDRRAWLVPALSVILQMVHVWADIYLTASQTPPYAAAMYDGGQAAYDALKGHLDDELGYQFFLKDLVAQLWANLTKLRNKQPWLRSSIYGYDFMDVVKERPEVRMRSQSIKCFDDHWTTLVGLADTVLVCEKIGNVILPDNSTERCVACASVPTGIDYFTTTLQCLRDGVGARDDNQLPDQITPHCRWRKSNDPFPECSNNAECSIKLQELVTGTGKGKDKACSDIRNNPSGSISSGSTDGSGGISSRLEITYASAAITFGKRDPNRPALMPPIRNTILHNKPL
ncbi:MAG: hypothetical protein M1839_000010 [Geoglossum umbratile]|nr:MAG: hypothetical protein M1839_000010 [Geoglossum umbratile]